MVTVATLITSALGKAGGDRGSKGAGIIGAGGGKVSSCKHDGVNGSAPAAKATVIILLFASRGAEDKGEEGPSLVDGKGSEHLLPAVSGCCCRC